MLVYQRLNTDLFIQHVFDNADVNVKTLDGHGTFHAMGGIQCISPSKNVEINMKVERISSGSFNTDFMRQYSCKEK